MLPMPPHQCRFCGHVNPDGAKYCNECGSQLNLRPCRLCDAINDVAAEHCHKCGAALPEQAAPALAPVAAVAALSGSVAPLRERESEPVFAVVDADAIAGDGGAAGAAGAPADDRRSGVGTVPASRWAWVAAAVAVVGIAAYLAYSPDGADDAGGPSQAGPSDPARNPAAGGATSASPASREAMPTATSSSGAPEQLPVDPGAPVSSSLATGAGAETPAAGVSSPASGGMLAPGASPGAPSSAPPTANAAANQAGKAKAKPKAKPKSKSKPKPKPKPKAKPKSQTAK